MYIVPKASHWTQRCLLYPPSPTLSGSLGLSLYQCQYGKQVIPPECFNVAVCNISLSRMQVCDVYWVVVLMYSVTSHFSATILFKCSRWHDMEFEIYMDIIQYIKLTEWVRVRTDRVFFFFKPSATMCQSRTGTGTLLWWCFRYCTIVTSLCERNQVGHQKKD